MVHSRPRRSRLYRNALKLVDALEPRTLMSITATSAITPGVYGNVPQYDSNGHLWVVNAGNNGLEIDDLNGTAAYNIDSIAGEWNTGFLVSNGHAYLALMTNDGGGIEDVNLANGQMTYTQLTNDFNQAPFHLTATGNAIWYDTQTQFDNSGFGTNRIGRWVPGSSSADVFTIDSSFDTAEAANVNGDGADTIWVAMDGMDTSTIQGPNSVLKISFSGGVFTQTTYAVNSGDPVADANDNVEQAIPDGSGGAWYNLSTSTSTTFRTQFGPDALVHLSSNGTQTSYPIPQNDNPTTTLGIDFSPIMGPGGKLWFNEMEGTQAGYLDTSTGNYDVTDYPAGTENPAFLAVDPTSSTGKAVVMTFPSEDNGGNPIITLTVDQAQQVPFGGAAYDQAAQEKTAITGTLLATFTAPDLAAGQNYTATVTWGDNTTSTITATSLGDNSFALAVGSKTFASQGNYAGSISIADPSNNVVGTLTFTSHISDTPLDVTSFAATPLILRIATATGTFTDDAGEAASTFTATINWGDGTHSTGLVVANPFAPGQYIIIGVHQYSKKGTYNVQLTVTTTEANAAIEANTASATVKV